MLARQIRELLQRRNRKVFRPRAVTKALGLDNGVRVRVVLEDMAKRGEVERLGDGRYRYLGHTPGYSSPTNAPVKRLVWRAAWTKKTFSVREIRSLADVAHEYACRVVRELVAAGDVRRIGKRVPPGGGAEWIHEVVDPDEFYRKYVL